MEGPGHRRGDAGACQSAHPARSDPDHGADHRGDTRALLVRRRRDRPGGVELALSWFFDAGIVIDGILSAILER